MNVDLILDTGLKALGLVVIESEIRQKLEQLDSIQGRRCGNCFHWMKTSCKPENEHGQFKSCISAACKDFKLKDNFGLAKKLTDEINELLNKLDELRKGMRDEN